MSWSTDSSDAILTENTIGCAMKGTFGVVKGLFKAFGPNKMCSSVSNNIYPATYESCHTS